MRQTERAIFDLRSGHPIVLRAGGGVTLVQPVEGLDREALATVQAFQKCADSAPINVVMTSHRFAAMRPDLNLPSNLIAMRLPEAVSPEQVVALATALEPELSLSVTAAALAKADLAGQAAITLARRGRLLPAVLTLSLSGAAARKAEKEVAEGAMLALDADRALANAGPTAVSLERVSEARVPLEGAENTRFVLFREGSGMREHIALLIGEPDQWPQPVPVRLHSACLTGDLFGSLRCDCGEQLRSGVEAITQCGGGILLYLAQEGRDIGLANKLRAYTLQDTGLDTVDADQVLGFSDDERHYDVAVSMLQALEVERIALLTNNPTKINAVRRGGIDVVSRHALHGKVNVHNHRYLSAKASRSGHLLSELLDQEQGSLS